ncbi:transporter substrate-binding domain-containing protein [Castellaniella sp.]|uniref:transporter substrate-binding domain-containing protein n=1 Tax=Castellaniella sp. TaxID=1955812 RepID=UPI002AFE4078|nr:transporter substrate-binding domain-containing protein [Castellaniella sp.]
MKTTLLGAALLIAAGLIPAASSAADAQELKIATEAGYPPFEYRNPNGQLEGFDIDIGNELCKRLQRKCVWIDQSFDGLIPGLQARKFDLANSTMTATEARKKVIDFSTPMYIVPVKLMVKKGSGLEPTAESLKGKRVGVQQGTTMETYARKYWAPKGVTVVSYPSYTNAYVDVTAGRLDATFQEAQSAVEGFLSKPEGADYELAQMTLDDPILNDPIAMGLRKGNKLKTDVDKVLKAMLADGTIQGFAKKYFAEGLIQFPAQ